MCSAILCVLIPAGLVRPKSATARPAPQQGGVVQPLEYRLVGTGLEANRGAGGGKPGSAGGGGGGGSGVFSSPQQQPGGGGSRVPGSPFRPPQHRANMPHDSVQMLEDLRNA